MLHRGPRLDPDSPVVTTSDRLKPIGSILRASPFCWMTTQAYWACDSSCVDVSSQRTL